LRNFASPGNPSQRAAELCAAFGSTTIAPPPICNRKLHRKLAIVQSAANQQRDFSL
jgi:hypothetical protein